MRQRTNFLYTLRARPQTRQRRTLRVENFGFRAALMIIALLAIFSPRSLVPGSWSLVSLAERHAEMLQERPCPVVPARRCDDGDVQTLRLVGLRVVDLGEDEMIAHSQRVVAAPVEGLRRDAAEVADPRERNVDQAVQEFVHPFAAQRDPRPDRHAR